MKIRQLSAIYFQEDDTFVVVFAFVHLAERQGPERQDQSRQIAFPAGRVRPSPTAIPFRAGFTRQSPEARGLSGPPAVDSVVKSADSQGCARLEQ